MELQVGAKVVNGQIIVIDDSNEEHITIKACENINLFINGKPCDVDEVYKVNSSDTITYNCIKTQAKREIEIVISEDKMKAFISVEYTPEIEYKLKERELFLNLALTTEIISKKEPEYFTISELHKMLNEKGIIYGIKEDELKNALNGTTKKILIAEGTKAVNDVQSEIKPFFTPSQMFFPDPESNEKIDYKNLFRISNVNSGDKIAEIIPEIAGKDGMNVFGKVVKKEYVRNMPIKASDGCKIENNDVISLIDGKAHILNRSIGVNPVYAVESVDMETCNIKFYGDIEVYNSVNDHMSVSAGGALDVSQNVNTSNVITGGEITILGNAINSKILSGHIDIVKKEYAKVLISYKEIILKMIQVIKELKLEDTNYGIGSIVKTITEKKFNDFQKVSLNIVSINIKNKIKYNKLVDFIKEKVLGYNILNMKSIRDLINLVEILDNEIDYYNKNIIVPLDIRMSYCQDCEIKSTGNIIITGKGEYTSYINAMNDIMFTRSDSVARGGTLLAGGKISAGIVGSKAEVVTTLKVPKSGTISAVVAYSNTRLCFGNATLILEETRKNINAHFNEGTGRIEIVRSALS